MKFDNLQEVTQKVLVEGLTKKQDVKVESADVSAQTELEKAFTVEVKYWLQSLADENSNDEVGQKAIDVVDSDEKVKSIVDELVNGSDDLWEEIHLKIEELAGINYEDRIKNK